MTNANSSLAVRPEVLAQYVSRLLAGETIPMTALAYLNLTEYVQAISDEQTYQEFGRLASTLNESLSLGHIAIYDIFIKPHAGSSSIVGAVADILSVAGAEKAIGAMEFHSSRYVRSDEYYHYFSVTRQVGAPDTELRLTIARQDDDQFQIHTWDALSGEWEMLDSISSDWSQEE
ncbi:hypothetical protein [Paenibacillus sp. Y412MC10]|uniref:hypothetical protein n=1 Tax=Geobacillus sp. (strain Y412MC10) TaxID=481743 RepID=UPI0011AB4D8A|nr:hypothetical protein [Paenibacillus sp. Y412MC10]